MPDLSAFGAGIPRDAPEPTEPERESSIEHRHLSFPNGRCRAIKVDGTRCRSDSQMVTDICHTHEVWETVTIDDGAIALIEETTRTRWQDFENELVRVAVERLEEGDA